MLLFISSLFFKMTTCFFDTKTYCPFREYTLEFDRSTNEAKLSLVKWSSSFENPPIVKLFLIKCPFRALIDPRKTDTPVDIYTIYTAPDINESSENDTISFDRIFPNNQGSSSMKYDFKDANNILESSKKPKVKNANFYLKFKPDCFDQVFDQNEGCFYKLSYTTDRKQGNVDYKMFCEDIIFTNTSWFLHLEYPVQVLWIISTVMIIIANIMFVIKKKAADKLL